MASTIINLEGDALINFENGLHKLLKIADYTGAINDFNEVNKIHPDHFSAIANRASAKGALKDFTGAIADASKAIEIDPEIPGMYFVRGQFKNAIKDHEGAITDLSTSIEKDPKDARPYLQRGISLVGIGMKDKALLDFKKARDLGMSFPQGVLNFMNSNI